MLKPGDYFVRLTAHQAGLNPYHLVVTVTDPPKLSIADTSVYEADNAMLSFPVTLDKTSTKTVTIQWATANVNADGKATPGVDFRKSGGLLTFAPGETEKTADVPVIDDDIEASGETVGVNLNNPTQAVIDRERALGTILNEDVLGGNNSEATLTVDAEPTKSYLDTNVDHDWFRVSLPAAPDDPFYIEVKGVSSSYASLFDPKVMLRDSAGTVEVASDNNSGSGRNARLKYTNTTEGTYIIDVYSAEPARTGSYMVTVSTKGDDCLATTSTTCTLVLGNHRSLNDIGEIEFEGDEDWYAVELTANQRYEIKVTGSLRPLSVPLPHPGEHGSDPRDGEGSLLDPKLVGVYNEDGDYIEGTFDDNSGTLMHPRLIFTPDTTGKHYVSVGAKLRRGEAAGSYRVIISTTTSRDDCVANTQARTLANGNNCLITVDGGLVSGYHENHGDVDWHQVTLEASTEYRVDAVAKMHNPKATTQSTNVIGMYDSNGDMVPGTAKRERSDGSMSTRFFFTTPAQAGNYFLGIGNHERGTYLLSIRTKIDDFPDGTQGTVTVGDEGTLGELEWRYDRDWFQVRLDPGTATEKDFRIRVGWPDQTNSGTAELSSGKVYKVCYDELNEEGTDCATGRELTALSRPTTSAVTFTVHNTRTYYFQVGAYHPYEDWEFMVIGDYYITVKPN